jgi:hypothetical protein
MQASRWKMSMFQALIIIQNLGLESVALYGVPEVSVSGLFSEAIVIEAPCPSVTG